MIPVTEMIGSPTLVLVERSVTQSVTDCHQCEDVLGEMRFEPSTRTHFSSLFHVVLFRKESGDLIPIVFMVQHKMFT